MLSKEYVKTLFISARESTVGLSVIVFKNGEQESHQRYTSLPCYGSIPSSISNNTLPDRTFVFPWQKSKGRALLFREDGPFTDLFNIIYNHSYKEHFTFDEFKAMTFEQGIILEGSMLKDWCSASFMALIMAGRDTVYTNYKDTMPFKDYRKNYSSGSAWFPALRDGVEVNTSVKIQPIYTAKDNPYPQDCYYTPFAKEFLEAALGKHTSNWTSGTDVVYFLVTGVPNLHDSYRRLASVFAHANDKCVKQHHHYYQKDKSLVKNDLQISKLSKQDPDYLKALEDFNKRWKR